MNELKDHSVTVFQTIEDTPEHVFEALIDESLMEKWFCPLDRGFTAEVSFPAAIGSPFQIDMIDTDGSVYIHKGVIDELAPDEKIVLTWNSEAAEDSIVSIKLAKRGTNTEIKLLHWFNTPAEVGEHKKGWAELLDNLRRMLED